MSQTAMSKHVSRPRALAADHPRRLPLDRRARIATALGVSVLVALIATEIAFGPWTRSASSQVLIARADAFVSAGAPLANRGASLHLRTDGRPFEIRSYVRFEVPRVSGGVQSLRLRLFGRRTNDPGVAVRAVRDNRWDERAINYLNAPPMSARLAHSGPIDAGRWMEVDVTELFRGHPALRDGGELTLGITRSPYTLLGHHDFKHRRHAENSFASREDGALGPRLVVGAADAQVTSTTSPSDTTVPVVTTVPATTAPSTTVTSPPGGLTPASSCSGPLITLTGRTAEPYKLGAPPNAASFDLAGWYSDAVGLSANHAFVAGDDQPPLDLCVLGGVVNGHISLASDWAATHDYGGYGYRTASRGLTLIDGVRVHNVEDGWKPREAAAARDVSGTYPNVGRMLMRHAYLTGIRDDAIEDDEFMPGDIRDSLFDGVWCFLSEQNQTGGTPVTIGAGEDRTIRITRDYVRLAVTNGGETGAGHWFKWQGRGSQNHTLVITDSVFAVDREPRLGWSSLGIPPGTVWQGQNFILWLGAPGGYGGPRPQGVDFLEGQAATDKWSQVRNGWLSAHGYASRPAADLNPMDDPVLAAGA